MYDEVLVRSLRHEDADSVRSLDGRILGPDRSITWTGYIDRFLRLADVEALPEAPWGCFVAEIRGRVVGFLLSELRGGEYGMPRGAWIMAVAVDPKMRRKGIGRKLVDELVTQCRQRRVPELYAALLPGDNEATLFLRGCGLDPSKSLAIYSRTA
ncbi:MAG: GNAT family N-acetyltransferase [Chloroflexi bacterium]|nr:GNAT family N-acetyltransferase [Chloroflexota bacterium]